MGEKIYIIDANVFLELALKRQREAESFRFLNEVAHSKVKAVVAAFTLHSIEMILFARGRQEVLSKLLAGIVRWQSCDVYQTSVFEEREVLALTTKLGLDFDDTLQYYLARKFKAVLVSFDKHFDKTDIERQEPRDVLAQP